jgi:D-arabinose 5-phosphate isomerase GutQ
VVDLVAAATRAKLVFQETAAAQAAELVLAVRQRQQAAPEHLAKVTAELMNRVADRAAVAAELEQHQHHQLKVLADLVITQVHLLSMQEAEAVKV